MADVIFCVDFTEAMRPLISLSEAMRSSVCLRQGGGGLKQYLLRFFGKEAVCKRVERFLAVLCFQDSEELAGKLAHPFRRHVAEQAFDAQVNERDFLFYRQGAVLRLDEQGGVFPAIIQYTEGKGVEVAAEFSEGFQFAVLRLVGLQGAGNLVHGLQLGLSADSRYGNTHVDGRGRRR